MYKDRELVGKVRKVGKDSKVRKTGKSERLKEEVRVRKTE